MKKLVSFVLAAVLCVGMTTAVMAAPSPIKSPDTSVAVTTDESSNFDSEELLAWNAVVGSDDELSADEVVAVATSAGVTLTADKVDEVMVYDIDPAEVTVNADGTKTAERTVAVDPAYTYTWKALVYDTVNDVWDEAEAGINAATGKLAITSTHFCPTIVVAEKTLKTVTPVVPVPQPTTPVAPKTADVAMLGLVAVAALAGAVTAGRKVK